MGGFNAKLELPRYIAKEEILNKQVFDSEIKCIGPVKDWTYSSDGTIKMVVKIEEDPTKAPVLIPFYQIHKVGEFIMLKVKRSELRSEFGVTLQEEPPKIDEKKVSSRLFDRIDSRKLEELASVNVQAKK